MTQSKNGGVCLPSGDDHERCLQDLKAWERNKCKIKVFDGISRPAPYVLISGTKKKAVKGLDEEVVRVSMR